MKIEFLENRQLLAGPDEHNTGYHETAPDYRPAALAAVASVVTVMTTLALTAQKHVNQNGSVTKIQNSGEDLLLIGTSLAGISGLVAEKSNWAMAIGTGAMAFGIDFLMLGMILNVNKHANLPIIKLKIAATLLEGFAGGFAVGALWPKTA